MDHLLDQDHDHDLIAALRRLDAAQAVALQLGDAEALRLAAELLETSVGRRAA